MSVPDAAVSFLLENITQILKYNYNLVAGVKDSINELKDSLKYLEANAKEFAKYDHDNELIKVLVKEMKSTIDDAEDAVDTYLVQAAVQKSRGWVSKTFHIIDYPKKLRDVGKSIQQIGDKVKQISSRAEGAYLILKDQVKLGQFRKSKEDPKVEEEHVVGFDKAIAEVSELLTAGSERLEVISIVGMLGLGKTTLAKKVFNDKDVDFEYMIRVFVYVSKEYERKEVFLKILRSVTKSKINEEVTQMTEDQLEEHVRDNLEGKQYLIVLDDIWEKEDWNRLKDAFPNNKKRCRVLITTRYDKVAEHAQNSSTSFYRLDFLPLEKSRELLRWKVFRDNNGFSKELEEYEEQIAVKCDGLPLAIVVIAGILFNHRDRVDWWKHVADSVKEYIARDQEQTTLVIELMYKHLPNHLKPCFMYLGLFPEDYEIPVWKLVRLWIAEGLIRKVGSLNMEDVAEEYLEELVCRNLVMVAKRRSNEKIKTCNLHDTLREFCKKEAAEENLFQEIKKENLPSYTSIGNKVFDQPRRLCINNVNISDFISSPPSGKCVRSLLTFTREEIALGLEQVSSIPKTFKLLRVLEIQSLKFPRFPIDLIHLILLKYIAISSNFQNLPKTMSALWNLQTLIVNTESTQLEIKADIWKLPQFRHLHTNTSTILPCPDSKNSPNIVQDIQTLSTISPESCGKFILGRAHKLKNLGIRGRLSDLFNVESGSSLFDNLRELGSLENLRLVNDEATSKLCLPSSKSFPQNLTELTLLGTRLDWQEMPKLGMLEKLEILKLKGYAFEGKKWQTGKGGFLLLRHLHIGTTDLEEWEASEDHFPKLKCLELNSCDKLKAIPEGLADICSLQLVGLHCTNIDAVSSALRIQAKKEKKDCNFKLSVYPPDHLKKNLES